MKLAIVTDAWRPQVNGVVTTLQAHARRARARSAMPCTVFSPAEHRTIPCPTYPEIRLALWPGRRLARRARRARARRDPRRDRRAARHGGRGATARRRGLAFTTSYHTQFPQYVRKRLPIPRELVTYALLRRHHGRARRTLVATEQQRRDLIEHGFSNVVLWSRGVDAELFQAARPRHLKLPRPICVYVRPRRGRKEPRRVSRRWTCPARRSSIGDGPDRSGARARATRARRSWVTGSASSSRAACRRPTCSSSRAARTPSGS